MTKPDGTTLQIDPDNTEIVTNPNGSAFVVDAPDIPLVQALIYCLCQAFWGDVDSEEGLLRHHG